MVDGDLEEMVEEFSDGRVSYGCTFSLCNWVWVGVDGSCQSRRSKHKAQQVRSHRMGTVSIVLVKLILVWRGRPRTQEGAIPFALPGRCQVPEGITTEPML